MRAYVYVDGFNLYYRALKDTPHRWVNLSALAGRLLDPADQVAAVRYFTARVGARSPNDHGPKHQQMYLSALGTDPLVHVHYGKFLAKTKRRPLVTTGAFVEVHDTEEKGSDVNLATHLMNDGWNGSYEVALVLSQDTDLVEPIRILAKERNLRIGLVWLDGRQPNPQLKGAASFVRHLSNADLAAAQFPNPVIRANGTPIARPEGW